MDTKSSNEMLNNWHIYVILPKQREKGELKYSEVINEAQRKVSEYEKKFNEWKEAPETTICSDYLPIDYWNEIDSLITLVESKRADTLKEVINLYENIQHQSRMENMQQEQLAVTRETNDRITALQHTTEHIEKHAANTERYAKSTAHSAKVGNVIGVINTIQLHNVSKNTKK